MSDSPLHLQLLSTLIPMRFNVKGRVGQRRGKQERWQKMGDRAHHQKTSDNSVNTGHALFCFVFFTKTQKSAVNTCSEQHIFHKYDLSF